MSIIKSTGRYIFPNNFYINSATEFFLEAGDTEKESNYHTTYSVFLFRDINKNSATGVYFCTSMLFVYFLMIVLANRKDLLMTSTIIPLSLTEGKHLELKTAKNNSELNSHRNQSINDYSYHHVSSDQSDKENFSEEVKNDYHESQEDVNDLGDASPDDISKKVQKSLTKSEKTEKNDIKDSPEDESHATKESLKLSEPKDPVEVQSNKNIQEKESDNNEQKNNLTNKKLNKESKEEKKNFLDKFIEENTKSSSELIKNSHELFRLIYRPDVLETRAALLTLLFVKIMVQYSL